MQFQTTNVPAADDVDIPVLKESYRRERDKRIRRDGQEQYAPQDENLTQDSYEQDSCSPVVPRDAIDEDLGSFVLAGTWAEPFRLT